MVGTVEQGQDCQRAGKLERRRVVASTGSTTTYAPLSSTYAELEP